MIEIDLHGGRGNFVLQACFTAPADGVTAVFGASGSGKSTLLDMIAGHLEPDRGRVVIAGRVLLDTARGIHLPAAERQIGWVPQDGLLFPHLDVAANLRFGAKRRRQAARFQEARVIDALGIGQLLERWPEQLSGGERQRVALGRALLAEPALLLLDEPLAAVDAPRKAEILALLDRIKHEFALPVLHVTHSLAEVLRLADHLVLLENGKVIANDRIDALLGRAQTPLLSTRADAGSLLNLRIHPSLAKDDEWLLDLEGQTVQISGNPAASPLAFKSRAGADEGHIRAYVPANEVIIATQQPVGLSVRNVLRARIICLRDRHDGSVLIELAVGRQHLLAAVTAAAVHTLDLVPDREVFALVKSLSLDAPAGLRLLELG